MVHVRAVPRERVELTAGAEHCSDREPATDEPPSDAARSSRGREQAAPKEHAHGRAREIERELERFELHNPGPPLAQVERDERDGRCDDEGPSEPPPRADLRTE